VKELTAKEVEVLITKGEKLNIIDVREVNELLAGKIPGAVNIPFGLIEFRMHELDKSIEYIVVCRSGARSGRASQFLDYKGFKVINMAGGMLSWEGPVDKIFIK